MERAGHVQLDLRVAEEEGAVGDLGHLEEEGEDVQERGAGQELGEVLDLFTGGVDTSLLGGVRYSMYSVIYPRVSLYISIHTQDPKPWPSLYYTKYSGSHTL